jgi:hypothetical protein
MDNKEAVDVVKNALVGYSQDSIGSDKEAQAELDKAWKIVSKAARKGFKS